jgi:hypothetical protein
VICTGCSRDLSTPRSYSACIVDRARFIAVIAWAGTAVDPCAPDRRPYQRRTV